MLVGQTVSGRMHVTAPAAGTMNVVIPDGAFRIRQLISHTGAYRMQNATIPLANGTTRQTIVSVPIVDQQIMVAPWTIAVKAGQDVEIIVDVTTQRTIKLGEHASAVQINHSNGRSTSVPIHARLDGLLFGIGIHMDGLFYVLPGNDATGLSPATYTGWRYSRGSTRIGHRESAALSRTGRPIPSLGHRTPSLIRCGRRSSNEVRPTTCSS